MNAHGWIAGMLGGGLLAGLAVWPGSLRAAALAWDGGGGADKGWSNPANWDSPGNDQIPDATTDVTISSTADLDTVLDADFTIRSISFFGDGTADDLKINQGGAFTLTVGDIRIEAPCTPHFNVPVALPGDATIQRNALSTAPYFNQPISGPYKLTLTNSTSLSVRLHAVNTFSGGLDVGYSYVSFKNGGLGTGTVRLGALLPDQYAVLAHWYTPVVFDLTTNTVIVEAGAGLRRLTCESLANRTNSLPMPFVLHKDFEIMPDKRVASKLTNNVVVLTGPLSGAGGVILTLDDQGNPSTPTLVLAGTNTYTGATLVQEGGTLTVQGVLGNARATVETGATLDGGGTIVFHDGETLQVEGTLDATALAFDLSALRQSAIPVVLADYAAGAFLAPDPLSGLLCANSRAWSLTDTGTQLLAQGPAPGSLIQIR